MRLSSTSPATTREQLERDAAFMMMARRCDAPSNG
jgi:hypothetical protein